MLELQVIGGDDVVEITGFVTALATIRPWVRAALGERAHFPLFGDGIDLLVFDLGEDVVLFEKVFHAHGIEVAEEEVVHGFAGSGGALQGLFQAQGGERTTNHPSSST